MVVGLLNIKLSIASYWIVIAVTYMNYVMRFLTLFNKFLA